MGSTSLFFDTNAVLDLLGSEGERPRHAQVASLVSACIMDDVPMYVSVGALKDVYYVMRKARYAHTELLNKLELCCRLFCPVDLLSSHALEALLSGEPDFEDGLVRAQAEALGVSAIVTDDRSAFRGSAVTSLSAEDCLKRFWPGAA